MTGMDLTPPGAIAGEDVAASARLMDAIEAVIGPSLVMDTAFPRASVAAGLEPALQVIGTPREPTEQAFWQRFRQAGGHEAIVPVAFGADLFVWPPPALQPDRGRMIVVAFGSAKAARAAAPYLRDPGTALLFPIPARTWSVPAELGGYDPVLLQGRDGQRLALMVPRERGASASPGPKAVRYDDEARAEVIEAAALIHDGGHRSEGDAKYSWLWTGPSNHFRFVLPKAKAGAARLAEICVPRTEDPVNLDRLAVQVNGRPVAFGLDRWSETSGKAKVPLPEGEETWVVTLVVPRMTADGQSDRRLGLCLDKVILQP